MATISEFEIDPPNRLSRSALWDIQRTYFLSQGIAAWQTDEVPHQITSNPIMANAYSHMAMAYLQDVIAAHDPLPDSPITIVELGAGSGRLAYHFLHHFIPQLAQSRLAGLRFRYVLTDFVPEILDFWQAHPLFQELIAAGIVDFALFDAINPQPLQLRNTAVTLSAETTTTPLILIANYFFDSIPQDCFAITDNSLHENLLALYSNRPEPDWQDATLWDRIELAYETIPARMPVYKDATANQILQQYTAELTDTVFTFPNIGLDCLRFWQPYGSGKQLLLTADRGHLQTTSLLDQDDPLPNLHGSFSLMVNYDALIRYGQESGWQLLTPHHYQNNLQVMAVLLGDHARPLSQTEQAFEDFVVHNGPNDFFDIKQLVESQLNDLSLAQLLAFLRSARYDADVFTDMVPALLTQLKKEGPVWYEDVYNAVYAVWQQYFPLGEQTAPTIGLGRVLAEIGCFEEATDCLAEATAWADGLGRDPTIAALITLCQLGLTRPEAAHQQLQILPYSAFANRQSVR